jgi:hypothetical protein
MLLKRWHALNTAPMEICSPGDSPARWERWSVPNPNMKIICIALQNAGFCPHSQNFRHRGSGMGAQESELLKSFPDVSNTEPGLESLTSITWLTVI